MKASFRSFHVRGWILLFQRYIWVVRGWEETETRKNTREHRMFLYFRFHSTIMPEQKGSSFRIERLAIRVQALTWANHPQYYLNYGYINSGFTSVWCSVKPHKAITSILFASAAKIHGSLSTFALMNEIISIWGFFFFNFVDENQSWLQRASLIIHWAAGWGLLQLNLPRFLAFLSSACWGADASWSPRGQTCRFLVNMVTLWRWESLQNYTGTYETITV